MNTLNKFKNQTFVIKYGGSIMNNASAQKAFAEDLNKLKKAEVNLVIVHGGGPEISSWLKAMNIENSFCQGLRVTTVETMKVVEMVLSGLVNKNLAANLCNNGLNAVGISGRDCSLIKAKKKFVYDNENNPIDIGFVGDVESVQKEILLNLLHFNNLPVISPIGCDDNGNSYNINADYVAAAVAGALNANKLIIMTDIDGVYKDINDKTSLIKELTVPEIRAYIKDGTIQGGMIPKMQCCMDALSMGTEAIHLLDGRVLHTIITSLNETKGTKISLGGDLS